MSMATSIKAQNTAGPARHIFWLTLLLSFCLTGCAGSANTGKYYDRDGPPGLTGTLKAHKADEIVIKSEKPNKWANRPYTVMGQRFYPMTGDKPLVQTGTASWYGKQFHGKKTAIGEIYDMYSLSAAHPTMELPSYARVTNLNNERSVIVRVNDRGPFIGGRAIDMSYAAAVKLGYQKNGTTRVRIERITRRQIALGNIPSATHTSTQFAEASGSKLSTVIDTVQAVAASGSESKTKSDLAAAAVKETIRLIGQKKSGSSTNSVAASGEHIDKLAAVVGTALAVKATVSEADKDPLARIASVETFPSAVDETQSENSEPLTEGITETAAPPQEPVIPSVSEGVVQGVVASSTDVNAPAATQAGQKELQSLDSVKQAWGAQIGAFTQKASAQEFAAHAEMMLSTENIRDGVRIAQSAGNWCVLVGSAADAPQARAIVENVSKILGIQAFAAYK